MSVANEDDFWEAALLILGRPGVTQSTMMGYQSDIVDALREVPF